MPHNDDRSSFTASLRLSAIQACERLSEGKSVTLKWMTDHIERLRAAKEPGRPKGSRSYDDEAHLIEMGRLLETSEATNTHRAAVIVVDQNTQFSTNTLKSSHIRRLSDAFDYGEERWRRLGRDKITKDKTPENL